MMRFARGGSIPIVTDSTALFLQFICGFKKPKKILEIGTAIGYSAVLMQQASDMNTEVITLERDEKMYQLAMKNISDMGLENKIKVVFGDAKETLLDIKDNLTLFF
jgi:predicted O-methyltransferase YrrM